MKSVKQNNNKRKSLYRPVSKAMVLYKMGVVPLGMDIAKGLAICERT